MNMLLKRAAFWVLLVLFIAGSIWWTLHVPYQPRKLLRAIPGHAVVVSMHDQLAGRLDEVVEHPFASLLIAVSGGSPGDVKELLQDEGFRYIKNLVGERDLVMAYVPFLSSDAQGSWVFAGWIGGKSQRLRITAPFLTIKDLRRLDNVGGWPVWTYVWSVDGQPQRLTMALVEGMIIGVMARDPRAIELLIDACNGAFPSMDSRHDLLFWTQSLMDSPRQDRFLFKQTSWPESRYWLTEIDLSDSEKLQARVSTRSRGGVDFKEGLDVAGPASFWGADAITFGALESSLVRNILPHPEGNAPSAMFQELLAQANAPAVALGLFGGETSGRFRGIRVPTIMAGYFAGTQTDVKQDLLRLLDRWNARYRWGLVLAENRVNGRIVWRIESTADTAYAAIDPTEQIAFTVDDGWVYISSNYKGLESLLASRAMARNAADQGFADVMQDQAGRGVGYFGMDMARGNDTLRLAISAYSLKLLFEDAQGSRETRQKLNEAKAWLDMLARFGSIHMRISHEDEMYSFEVKTIKP